MALPKQVEQDLRDIEELEKQLTAPREEAPVDDGLGEAEVAEDTTEVVDQEPEVQPKAEPESNVETLPTEDFQQKYNTLRGKYDAEVPRLHAQVKELIAQVDGLKEQLEKKPEPEKVEPQSYVTDADREEYGDELLDVQRRVAMEVASKYEARLDQQTKLIEALEKKLDGSNTQVQEMSFEQRLHRIVPDFAEINQNPKWIAWLDEYDPMIRGPRRQMAQQAFANGDAEAVADYIKMFKGTQQEQVTQAKKTELEKQVTPSRSNTSNAPTSNEKTRVYSEKEMGKLWQKVTDLMKAGKFDDADKLEAEISVAYLEGRVK